MGIDARMLIRVPRQVTDEEIKLWSWDLAERLQAKNFVINEDHGAISRSEHWDRRYPSGQAYYQDGDDIIAKPGETLLKVHLWTRYYGPGYERGDLFFLIGCAEWIERNIPGAAVWYGGDSSGVCAEPWGKEERQKMLDHFYSPHGRDYYNSFGSSRDAIPPFPKCPKCVESRAPRRYGFGGDYAAYYCPGCGRDEETRDSGQTWTKKKDSF